MHLIEIIIMKKNKEVKLPSTYVCKSACMLRPCSSYVITNSCILTSSLLKGVADRSPSSTHANIAMLNEYQE